MALAAGRCLVLSIQWKFSLKMVEKDRCPAPGNVAMFASVLVSKRRNFFQIGIRFTVVRIGMTGRATRRFKTELQGLAAFTYLYFFVAQKTGNGQMSAVQGIFRFLMLVNCEHGRRKTLNRMAFFTSALLLPRIKLALMVVGMAILAG